MRYALFFLLSAFVQTFIALEPFAASEPSIEQYMAYVTHIEERLSSAIAEITGTEKVIVLVKAEFGVRKDTGKRSGRSEVVKTKEKAEQSDELLPGVPQKKQFTAEQPTVLSGDFQNKDWANFISISSVTILIDKKVPEERLIEAREVISRVIGPVEENIIDIKPIHFRNSTISSVVQKPYFYLVILIFLAGVFFTVIAYFLSKSLTRFSSGTKDFFSPSVQIARDKDDKAASNKEPELPSASHSPDTGSSASFSFIRPQDIATLSLLLDKKTSDEVAVVINFLSPELALKVLNNIPTEKRAETVVKLTRLATIDPDKVAAIEEEIKDALKRTVKGEDRVASLLGLTSDDFREQVFGMLEKQDSSVTTRLRKKVKSIETLLEEMPPQNIRMVFRYADTPVFASIIKTFSDDLKKKILDSLTEGGLERLSQEMDLSKPLPPARLMEEKSNLIAIIRRINEEHYVESDEPSGDLSPASSKEDDV